MDNFNQMQFSTIMKNDNYIVRDHRVHDVRIMPGVTFLDMIFRLLKSKGFNLQEVELRKVLFQEPVATTEEYDKKIHITFDKVSDYWVVKANSQKIKDNTVLNSNWDENLYCELHLRKDRLEKRVDIQKLINTCHEVKDMDYAYSYVRKMKINHLEFMKGLGKLYYGNGYILAEIHLSELAKGYLDYFYMHPAYLDAATLVQGLLVFREMDFSGEVKPSIPMHIASFRANEPMKDKIFVYMKDQKMNITPSTDIMYFDIEVYNEAGDIIADFKKWGLKQIRSRELISKLEVVDTSTNAQPVHMEINTTAAADSSVAVAYTSGEDGDKALRKVIESDLRKLVAKMRQVSESQVNPEAGFYDQGLDSRNLLELVGELEKKLGQQLYPTLLFEYTNIKDLSEYLMENYKEIYLPSVNQGNVKGTQSEAVKSLGQTGSVNTTTVYYAPQWFEQALGASGANADDSGHILVFETGDGIFEGFKKHFGQSSTVVSVKPGACFKETGYNSFEINPQNSEDYSSLLDALSKQNITPWGIVHCWSENAFEAGRTQLDRQLDNSIYSVFYLTKKLMGLKSKQKTRLLYAYLDNNGSEAVAYPMQPHYAGLASFLKCMNSENQKIEYKTVGIASNAIKVEALAGLLQGELAGAWENEQEVYYAGVKRLVKHINVVSPNIQHNEGVHIRERGVYLVTGGMGGLGLMFAQHLAGKKAKLILTGRTNEDKTKKAQIEGLRQLGAEAEYVKADVSRLDDVISLSRSIKDKYGALNGIIHCAGITQDAYIATKTRQQMDEVFSAKIYGTLNLDEAFKSEKLDFFFTFSSTAGILGNPGQSDYAYANGFMDNFAHLREFLRKEGLRHGRSVSVNWPLWEEGGMRASDQVRELLMSKFGVVPLSTIEGLKAFEHALELPYSQVLALEGVEERLKVLFGKNPTQSNSYTNTGINAASVRIEEKVNPLTEDIAIIGVSGRYPMADNIDEFWDNLKNGRDCISTVPEDRWNNKIYEDIAAANGGKRLSKWGGFINDADKFDPLFFNISPRDAETMDPQERLFLETVWETMEDGGYTKSRLKKERVGVFAGVMWLHYQFYNNERNLSTTTVSSVANRISYYFNFKGPSIGLDTMCSSSLTAIHLACQSLRCGECNVAVAGGVNLSIHPNKYLLLSQGNFTSSDGRCKSFGEGGDGYVPGEGVGAVFLKPLSQAEKDGDRIYGVIKGSSINHGGESSGFTVPNPNAQSQVISDTLKRSSINPRTISFIEAHGTGTSLGDPIEITGLNKAYGEYTKDKQFCSIGSAKSNIGHLESAAGIAAITKVLLQMKYKKLVPSIHSDKLNPNIRFEDSPFYVQRELAEWPKPVIQENGQWKVYPRRAGISAFGAGGSNAHIILEEYDKWQPAAAMDVGEYAIVLSARNEDRLKAYAQRLLTYLKNSVPGYAGIGRAKNESLSPALEDIRNIVTEILDIDGSHIQADVTVSELGFDNISMAAFAGRLNEKYNTEVDIRTLSEFDSLRSLAEYVSRGGRGASKPEKEIHGATGSFEIHQELTLANIAYTLQVGRDSMDSRLALVVTSIDELVGELESFCRGEKSSRRMYSGTLKANRDYNDEIGSDVRDAIGSRDMHKLAQLWISGAEIDWKLLYGATAPSIVSLPHYPFVKKRVWMENRGQEQRPVQSTVSPVTSLQKPTSTKMTVQKPIEDLEPYKGDEVKVEIIDGSIALVTMQDKKNRNMFAEQLVRGMMTAFKEIEANKKIKVIVVTGYESIFCMGGTQDQLLSISDQKSSFTDAPFLYRGMLECEIPVITAIQGHASGGGLLFGLYADIVVMSEESVYSAVFTKYGFTPGMGATFILKEKFGSNLATEMMFTAKSFRGEELRQRGASVIFRKKDEVVREALSIARMLADKPRLTLGVLKQELSSRILAQLLPVITREEEMHELTFTSDEVKERIRHFYINNEAQNNTGESSTWPEVSISRTQVAASAGQSSKMPLKLKNEQPAQVQNTEPQSKGIKLRKTEAAVEPPQKQQNEVRKLELKQEKAKPAPVVKNKGNQGFNEDDVQANLISIVSGILYIPENEINTEVSFKDFGVDSISGVEIVRDINKEFNLNVDAVAIYDYSTISLLSQYIMSLLNDVPATYSGVEAEEGPSDEDEIVDLLSRINDEDLDIDQIAQYLEDVYEQK